MPWRCVNQFFSQAASRSWNVTFVAEFCPRCWRKSSTRGWWSSARWSCTTTKPRRTQARDHLLLKWLSNLITVLKLVQNQSSFIASLEIWFLPLLNEVERRNDSCWSEINIQSWHVRKITALLSVWQNLEIIVLGLRSWWRKSNLSWNFYFGHAPRPLGSLSIPGSSQP